MLAFSMKSEMLSLHKTFLYRNEAVKAETEQQNRLSPFDVFIWLNGKGIEFLFLS